MEHKWGSFMGRAVYEDCKVSLRRPMQLLSIFEKAGKDAEQAGRFLSWVLPITNFPVIQNYVEGTVKKIHVPYGPSLMKSKTTGYGDNDLQLRVVHIEQLQPSKNKQSQGAAPNAIHSLDACHLMLISERCDFPVTTIHDSFGCLLADMPSLYRVARETFIELYRENPLPQLLECIGGDVSSVEFGTLDINLVLESEYCFA